MPGHEQFSQVDLDDDAQEVSAPPEALIVEIERLRGLLESEDPGYFSRERTRERLSRQLGASTKEWA